MDEHDRMPFPRELRNAAKAFLMRGGPRHDSQEASTGSFAVVAASRGILNDKQKMADLRREWDAAGPEQRAEWRCQAHEKNERNSLDRRGLKTVLKERGL